MICGLAGIVVVVGSVSGKHDNRSMVSGILAGVALVGTIVCIILEKDQSHITLLGGFTTTFGALAFGIQSQKRD